MFKAILGIFDLVPGWVWAVLFTLATISSCSEANQHLNTKVKAAEYKQQAEEREAQRAIVAAQLQSKRAEITALRAEHAQEINDALRKEHRKTELALAAGQSVRDRLQHTTKDVASGVCTGGDNTEAVKRAEAVTGAFGSLLGACDRVAESLAADAERLASQVRSLISSYDSLSLKPGPSSLDPFPNREQVHPSSGLRWNDVVHSSKPHTASDSGVDLRLRLLRVDALVGGQGNPATHHALDHP
jgi:hypothetical protein